MAKEIERKFLVKGDYKTFATGSSRIIQGYLCDDPFRSVRIRIRDERGFITVKGNDDAIGLTRFEWEKEISLAEAENLLKICMLPLIDKRRFLVPSGDHIFEVDEFYGDNEGLVIAEVELKTESEHFERPVWLGEEVTGVEKYYNVMLIRNPFRKWRK